MVDVTVDNFEELWPTIKGHIAEAVLIGFDSEFSGITYSSKLKNSLFDSMPERYDLLRQNVSSFTITQFGLTMMVHAPERNAYTAHAYNFYLCPRSVGRLDTRFSCQASSLEFLRRHNFDFNKFVYGGIPFLSVKEEASVREDLSAGLSATSNMNVNVDEHFLQACCSSVCEWLSAPAADQPPWTRTVEELVLRYLLQKELRRRFHSIWTSSHGNDVVVTRVGRELRRDLEAADDLDERFVTSLVGFARVMHLLRGRHVPLVGHNCLLDLMFMHSLFIAPLPKSYHRFKGTINRWFPEVYDTKHILYSSKDAYPEKVASLLEVVSLQALHDQLSSHLVKTSVLHSPNIRLSPAASRYGEKAPHEAGFDAYATALCCLRMAHLIAHRDATSSEQHRPLSAREHLAALKPWKNHVNVIRGSINYLRLDGADPPTLRPRWLHLATRGGATLDLPEVVERLSQHGMVDVRACSPRQALVAVGNYRCAKDVVREFSKDGRYVIAHYSLLKHSPVVRTLLWSGVLVSTGVGAALLISQFRRSP